jgi:NAD(P)H-dependent FMN reductase
MKTLVSFNIKARRGQMVKIGIIVGSTRPGRHADAVANWVFEKAKTRNDAQFEVVDIKDFDLPLLDEPIPPSQAQYSKPHTRRWAKKVASFDAYIFVTPEYNHAPSAALKNAIDYLYAEWNNKAAGFVSYGASASGGRAVEHLRMVMAELQVADAADRSFSPCLRTSKTLPSSSPATSMRTLWRRCSTR